jgi:hypothetical protein
VSTSSFRRRCRRDSRAGKSLTNQIQCSFYSASCETHPNHSLHVATVFSFGIVPKSASLRIAASQLPALQLPGQPQFALPFHKKNYQMVLRRSLKKVVIPVQLAINGGHVTMTLLCAIVGFRGIKYRQQLLQVRQSLPPQQQVEQLPLRQLHLPLHLVRLFVLPTLRKSSMLWVVVDGR